MAVGCNSETLTNLIQSIGCSKPAYCPPCVIEITEALEALIEANTVRIEAIEDGESVSMLANWLFN